MTDAERSILQRYAESLIQITVMNADKAPTATQAWMRKAHGVWKENEFAGRSEEFMEAARTCFNTIQRVLKTEITAEQATVECAKFWEETAA